MERRQLFVNPLSVCFHEGLDLRNQFHTVICDWRNGEMYEIGPFAYHVLKQIALEPGQSAEHVYSKLKRLNPSFYEDNEQKFTDLIRFLLSAQVIFVESPDFSLWTRSETD